DLGETFWYTVRAGDAGACGQNLSGPGGPAFGVLRGRIGPAAGTGVIEINCVRPVVNFAPPVRYPPLTNGPDLLNYDFGLSCQRLSPRFEWAEFYGIARYLVPNAPTLTTTNVTNFFGRLYYMGGPTVSAQYTPARTVNNGQSPTLDVEIWCRAALFNGKVSSFAFATFRPDAAPILPNDRVEANVRFDASAQSIRA